MIDPKLESSVNYVVEKCNQLTLTKKEWNKFKECFKIVLKDYEKLIKQKLGKK